MFSDQDMYLFTLTAVLNCMKFIVFDIIYSVYILYHNETHILVFACVF